MEIITDALAMPIGSLPTPIVPSVSRIMYVCGYTIYQKRSAVLSFAKQNLQEIPSLEERRNRASMAATSLKDMAANLADIASKYTPSDDGHDPASMGPKLEMISLCKQIMFSLMDGGMMTGEHSLQMAELVSVRTLMGLGVFEQMPQEPDSKISLKDLSEKSGVEDKLLERLLRVTVGSRFITQTPEG